MRYFCAFPIYDIYYSGSNLLGAALRSGLRGNPPSLYEVVLYEWNREIASVEWTFSTRFSIDSSCRYLEIARKPSFKNLIWI